MIGAEIKARDPLGAGVPVCIFLSAAAAVLAVTVAGSGGHREDAVGWALVATLPLLYILVRTAKRLPPVHLRLAETGIERLDRFEQIAYSEIETVTADGRLVRPEDYPDPPVPVAVRHTGGELFVPARTAGAELIEVYRHLLDRCPTGEAPLPEEIQRHYESEVEAFGADRVFAFRSRPSAKPRVAGRRRRCIGIALMLWGTLGLLGLTFSGESGVLIGLGAMGLMFGFLIWLLGVARSQKAVAASKASGGGIVISPAAFAMVQGPLTGVLKWEEIRAVRRAGQQHLRLSSRGAHRVLALQLEGTTVMIADLYDTPLGEIERHVRGYWRLPAD